MKKKNKQVDKDNKNDGSSEFDKSSEQTEDTSKSDNSNEDQISSNKETNSESTEDFRNSTDDIKNSNDSVNESEKPSGSNSNSETPKTEQTDADETFESNSQTQINDDSDADDTDSENTTTAADGSNQDYDDDEEQAESIGKTGEKKSYSFEEIIDIAGYGRFQRVLTFLAGLGWFADAFEIRILSILGNFLSCDWVLYRWHNGLLTSIVFIGMMFGAPCFGIIADKYGRRKSLAISLLLLALFGACSALSEDLETLLTVRIITGFVFGGATQGFTLCAEYYPAKTRGIAGFYLRYYWITGTILLILLTWLIMTTIQNWHYLVVAAALPSLLVFFSMNWFPESIRWYLVTGHYNRAVGQMSTLLSMNKVGPEKLQAIQLKKISEEEAKGNIFDLLKSPHVKTTLLIWYISFASSFHYFGISLISPFVIKQGQLFVPDHEGNREPFTNATSIQGFFNTIMPCVPLTTPMYVDLLWNTSAEFPGLLIFTVAVRYVDRRTLLSTTCLLNALVCMLLLLESRHRIPTLVVLFIARANCCGILQLVLIITLEAFPTTLRATGVGSGATFSKLGAALVPFVAQVLVIEDPISAVCIVGAVIGAGSAAGAFLPRETRDVRLTDLTAELVEQDREQAGALA